MAEPEAIPQKRERGWMRSLGPLLWWFLLVLVLFVYHTHQRLLELTRLKFTIDLEGKPVGEAAAKLDGQTVASGERISLGRHQFVVSHPKAGQISTNLFIWYGGRDLGAISLQRLLGVLALQVEPPAARLSVRGPEFSTTLTNSAGLTSTVPTDAYRIDAIWANHAETKQVDVISGQRTFLQLVPPLGGQTFESEPPGAIVVSNDGRKVGTTPFTLSELDPGLWKGELRLDGYIPVELSLMITAGHTNSFRTNLVNWQYAQAMETARAAFAAGEIERALGALSAALRAKPNDPDAVALEQRASVAKHLRQAEAMMAGKDYGNARMEAEAVLRMLPENAKALALLKEVTSREEQKREREQKEADARRQERLAVPRKAFDFVLRQHPEAPLFDEHELQAALAESQTAAAICRELDAAPAFHWTRLSVPFPDAFAIVGTLEVPGGLRRCMIAGAQTDDNETRIFFKVMEYKSKTVLGFQGRLTLTKEFVPLDPSRVAELSDRERNELKQGAALVEERIRRAVEQKSR